LIEAAASAPQAWAQGLTDLLPALPIETASIALTLAQARAWTTPGWLLVIRHLADGARAM
jgi:hypothetical protein